MSKSVYVCPATGSELKLNVEQREGDVIKKGYFESTAGLKYFINDGLPDFTYPAQLSDKQVEQYQYYQANAGVYDDIQGLTFAIQKEHEPTVRKKMVSYLELQKSSKVLELACGTGRDSENIAALLDKSGELFVQDISGAMLQECRKKLAKHEVPVDLSIGNASYLAFPNHYFDAVYSFGGLNVFEDPKRSLQEMVRVTKPGGRIVVGDESLPVWLYQTEFGKILLNGNPLFKFQIPFAAIPVEARDVTVRWIIGGVYYLIAFTVGVGEPTADFDIAIPGRRGGSLRTRYYGQLEGVTAETKQLVLQAAEQSKQSVHQWLEQTLKSAAASELHSTSLEEKAHV